MAILPLRTPSSLADLVTSTAPAPVPTQSQALLDSLGRGPKGTSKLTPSKTVYRSAPDTPSPSIAPGDEYTQRLAALQAQQQQAAKAREGQYSSLLGQYTQALGGLNSELDATKQQLAQLQAQEAAWVQANPGKTPPYRGIAPLQAKVADLTQQIQATGEQFNPQLTSMRADIEKQNQDAQNFYAQAQQAVQDINATAGAQREITQHNQNALDAYNKQLGDYNSAVDANTAYQKQLADWQANKDQVDADVAAGKYAVNPYTFIHSGASLPQILSLRQQVQQGNAHPNIGVPDVPEAPVAPAPVPTAPQTPDIQQNASIGNYSPEVLAAIGYQAPKNVQSWNYEKPKEYNAPPTTNSAPVSNPQPAPSPKSTTPAGTTQNAPIAQSTPKPLTTQQTSSQAARTSTTQQTQSQPAQPVGPINPATTLQPQTAGTVGGQAPNTEQNASANTSQPTPKALTNPEPFKQDEEKKDDNVWEV